MGARSSKERLLDIHRAIEKIDSFLSGKDFAAFSSDALLHDAVVRNLEVISEASRHVDPMLKARAHEIPWRNVADIGNWLRHSYDIVNDGILWSTIERDLPPLKSAVARLLAENGG